MAKKKAADPKQEASVAKKKTKDPTLVFAEKLRSHRELESRWAVLEAQETRVEYFRGKDFAELLRSHPELATNIFSPEELGEEESVEEAAASLLLESKLAVRCDRFNKTIRPGRKKLSRWPAKLELHESQDFVEEEGFYAWTFESSKPIWQTILTFLLPIFTVACCLFPVFPYWAKISVVYFLLGLLLSIFGLLFVRWLVFGIIWIVLGRRVWFFPSILAEEATLGELFRFWPDKDELPRVKLTTRLTMLLIVGVSIWFLVQNAPDENTRRSYRKKVTNIIDDVVTWSPAMLSGNKAPPANVTTAENATFVNGTQTINATTPKNESATVGDATSEDVDSEAKGEDEAAGSPADDDRGGAKSESHSEL